MQAHGYVSERKQRAALFLGQALRPVVGRALALPMRQIFVFSQVLLEEVKTANQAEHTRMS